MAACSCGSGVWGGRPRPLCATRTGWEARWRPALAVRESGEADRSPSARCRPLERPAAGLLGRLGTQERPTEALLRDADHSRGPRPACSGGWERRRGRPKPFCAMQTTREARGRPALAVRESGETDRGLSARCRPIDTPAAGPLGRFGTLASRPRPPRAIRTSRQARRRPLRAAHSTGGFASRGPTFFFRFFRSGWSAASIRASTTASIASARSRDEPPARKGTRGGAPRADASFPGVGAALRAADRGGPA